MRRSTRRRRRTTRKRRGGAKLDCAAEGFTYEMRLASLGRDYTNLVGSIHRDGEKRSYDELVDFTMEGRIVDWYIQQLGIAKEDIPTIKASNELKILGAFFHRYKIVAERVGAARNNLSKGVYGFFNQAQYTQFTGETSYDVFLKNPPPKFYEPMKKKIQVLANLVGDKAIDLPIETAIDRAQCVMFYIVKHKGQLPPGFAMDERIKIRAQTPIVLPSDLSSGAPGFKIEATIAWLDFAKRESVELDNVTFNVF